MAGEAEFTDWTDMTSAAMGTALTSLAVASGDSVVVVIQGTCVSFGKKTPDT